MKPWVCPKCDGEKKIDGKDCPTCDGSGVVWREETPKVGDSFTKDLQLHLDEPNDSIIRKIHQGIRNRKLDELSV